MKSNWVRRRIDNDFSSFAPMHSINRSQINQTSRYSPNMSNIVEKNKFIPDYNRIREAMINDIENLDSRKINGKKGTKNNKYDKKQQNLENKDNIDKNRDEQNIIYKVKDRQVSMNNDLEPKLVNPLDKQLDVPYHPNKYNGSFSLPNINNSYTIYKIGT